MPNGHRTGARTPVRSRRGWLLFLAAFVLGYRSRPLLDEFAIALNPEQYR